MADFVTLTPDNLAAEHLCCIIRSKKPHPGVEAKRQWLALSFAGTVSRFAESAKRMTIAQPE